MDKKEAWGSISDELLCVGITGGIASGKSEFTAEIKNLGGFIIDADKISSDLIKPDGLLNRRIVEAFGESILLGDGTLNRKALAGIIFKDPEERKKLDEIMHPAIFDEMVKEAGRYYREKAGNPPIIFVDAPLIVETGMENIFDVLVVINADEEARIKRLVEHKGYTVSEARSRIRSQVNDAQRMIHADVVIDNNRGLEDLKKMAGEVWKHMLKKAEGL